MRLALKIAGIALAVLLAAILTLPLYFDADQFRPALEGMLTDLLSRQVTIGKLKLELFSQALTGTNVVVAEDPAFGGVPFLRSTTLEAGIELWPLVVSRKFILHSLVFIGPEIEAIQSSTGSWNFSSLGAKPANQPAAPPESSDEKNSAPFGIERIAASNGRITFRNSGTTQPPLVLDKLNFEFRDFTTASPFTFTLTGAFAGGGGIRLDGKAGPINWGNAIASPVDANLHVTHLDLAASGVIDPSLGVAGVASIDGNVLALDSSALITGKLKGDRLKLSRNGQPAQRTLEVDFALEHNFTKQRGTIYRGDVHLGNAVAALTGTYRNSGDNMVLNLGLTGRDLSVDDLGAFLPAIDIVLPEGASIENGSAEVHFTAEGPADHLVSAGNFSLTGVRLTNFDLVTKLSVLDEMAGIKAGKHTEIETFHASMLIDPDGSSVQNIELVVPSIGKITGAGNVTPAHNLAFKMRAAIHHGMGKVAGIGSNGVPFTVSGTSQRPSFKADVKEFFEDKGKGVGGLFHKKKKSKPGEPESDETAPKEPAPADGQKP